jgi:hypothetical protein
MLYAWRYCYAHVHRPASEAPTPPVPGNEEHERMFQAALERAARKEAQDSLDPGASLDEPTYDEALTSLW